MFVNRCTCFIKVSKYAYCFVCMGSTVAKHDAGRLETNCYET